MKILYIFLLSLFVVNIYAKKKLAPASEPAKTEEATEVIEVKGQSRNFNMKLVLRSKKDKISFVKTRKNYREEILSTEP